MKKSIFIFCFLTTQFSNSYSQSLFSNKYYLSGSLSENKFVVTADSNYTILCQESDSSSNKDNCAMLKLRPDGSILWSKNIYHQFQNFFNSLFLDLGNQGYLVTASIIPQDTAFFVFLDTTGTLISIKSIQGLWILESVKDVYDSSIYLYGRHHNYGYVLMKCNLLGNIIWTKIIARPNGSDTDSKFMKAETDGGVLLELPNTVSGFPQLFRNPGLLKFDSSGTLLWEREVAINDTSIDTFNPYRLIDAGNNQYLLTAGYHFNSKDYPVAVLLDSIGRPIIGKTFLFPSSCLFYSCAKKNNDFEFLCDIESANHNYFRGVLTTDSLLNFAGLMFYGDTTLYNFGSDFILNKKNQLNIIGDFIDSTKYGFSLMNLDTNNLSCELNNSYNVSDSVIQVVDTSITINLSVDTMFSITATTLINAASLPLLIFDNCQNAVGVNYGFVSDYILLSPNPATTHLTLQLTNSSAHSGNYFITDLCGKQLKSGVLHSNSAEVDVSSLAAGLYFVEIQTGEGRVTGKFVKE